MPRPGGFCPYVGLTPYTAEYREYFFGRERDEEVISSNLFAASLTIVYGASGVGKSSLLQAAVVPRLTETDRTAAFYFNRWKETSFANALKAQLIASVNGAAGRDLQLDPALPFDTLLERAAKAFAGSILVVLDQFEDYLLYVAENEDGEWFDRELSRAVKRRGLDVGFLIALREDWLSKLQDRFKGRLPVLRNTIQLRHMEIKQAKRAIFGPLARYNVRYGATDGRVRIERELARAILRETETGKVVVSDSAGAGAPKVAGLFRIETSFLQLVLTKLWEAESQDNSNVLRASTLLRLGGAKKIVRDLVAARMAALSDDDRAVCASMFHLLVMPSGTKIAQKTEDLAGEARRPVEAILPILENLASGRILARSFPPERYEVFHDVFAPAVLDWRVKHQEALERARARKFRLLSIALAVMCVIAVAALITALIRQAESRSRELAAAAVSQLRVDPERSILLAGYALKSKTTPEAEDALHRAVLTSRVRRTIPTGDCGLRRMAISAEQTAAACADGSLRVWNRDGHPVFSRRAHIGEVRDVAFSPDGRLIATGGIDGAVVLQDAATGSVLATIPAGGGPLRALAFSGDGALLATGGEDGTPRLWDVRSRTRLAEFPGHRSPILGIAINRDGTRVLTAGQDGAVRLFDVAQKKEQPALLENEVQGGVWAAAFSPDGRVAAAAMEDQTVRLFDVEAGALLKTLKGHTKFPIAVSFSPDGGRLASAGWDGAARVWDVQSGDELAILAGHTGGIHSVWFGSTWRTVVTASFDGTIRTWDSGPNAERLAIDSTMPFNSVVYSPDGRIFVTASNDRTVKLWDAESGAEKRVVAEHAGEVWDAVFSPDGQRVASAANDSFAMISPVADGGQPIMLPHPVNWVHSVAYQPGGALLITGAYDGHVRFWKASNGESLFDLPAQVGIRVERVAFSPDGASFATASARTATIWDTQGRTEKTKLPHGADVRAIAFHPDGRRFATGANDRRVKIWDIPSARVLATLAEDQQDVTALVFDHSGARIATGDADGIIRIWAVSSGKREMTLQGNQRTVTALAFSPDDRALASSGQDGAVRVYVPALKDLMSLARDRITRRLTSEECREYLHANRCPALP